MRLAILLMTSIVNMAFANASSPIDGKMIFEKLDLSSFPSSMEKRLEPGKVHFKDYGFSLIKSGADLAVIQLPEQIRFSVVILKAQEKSALICLDDLSLTTGSRQQLALSIVLQNQKLVAKKDKVSDPRCPE